MTYSSPFFEEILAPEDWKARKVQLENTLVPLLHDHLKRRSQHRKDPVVDFLFEYYSFRPNLLLRWSPGMAVALQGEEADRFLQYKGFVRSPVGIILDPALFPPHRLRTVQWIRLLLAQTQQRQPMWNCFGMHEWAMVYRIDQPRHAQVPLRLSNQQIADFVESRPLLCTHFDAFRFFTPAAQPLNRLQLTRDVQENYEQPGCLHANMDLYKWAYKIYPWLPSELLVDTFLLAYEARQLDMRASPYLMTEPGWEPVCVETPEGRQQYQELQSAITQRAVPLRARLLQTYDRLLQAVLSDSGEETTARLSTPEPTTC